MTGKIEDTTAVVEETSDQIVQVNPMTVEVWFTASFPNKYHSTSAGLFDAVTYWTLDANDDGEGRQVSYSVKVEGWTVADCNSSTKEAVFKRSFICNQPALTAGLNSVEVTMPVICKGYWNA